MRDPDLGNTIVAAPVDLRTGDGALQKTVLWACLLNAREFEHLLFECRTHLYLHCLTGERLRPPEVIDVEWRTHAGDPAAGPQAPTCPSR